MQNIQNQLPTLRKSLDSVSLYELYESHWPFVMRQQCIEKYDTSGVIGVHFKEWPDNPLEYFIPREAPYYVQIPVKLIYSCKTYNRTSHISYDNCIKQLDYAGDKFDIDGSELITIFFDRKRNKFRVTRGNHRCLMKLLVDGPNATICCRLIPHHEDLEDDEMLTLEAGNFNQDNQVTGMTNQHKYKGLLFHDIEKGYGSYLELYKFLDSCTPKIGIAGTNLEAVIEVDAYRAVAIMMTEFKAPENSLGDRDMFLRKVIETQAKYAMKEGTKLSATLLRALAYFLTSFSVTIDKINKDNKIDAWQEFMEYIFVGRKNLIPAFVNLTQADLIKGNTRVRVPQYHVATIATLFNEFVLSNDIKITKGHKVAISTNNKQWKRMLLDAPPQYHNMINSNLSNIYTCQC